MRTLWMTVIGVVFTVAGSYTEAQITFFYTGSQLLEWCEGDTSIDDHLCRGFIVGTSDMTSAYVGWGNIEQDICIPSGAFPKQLKKVVIKGLNEKPEELHVAAAYLVRNVLYEAFPCD